VNVNTYFEAVLFLVIPIDVGSHSYQCYDLVCVNMHLCVCVCLVWVLCVYLCLCVCVCMCLFVCVGINVCLQCELLVLMREVWKMGCVVQDWKDAEIVPIPKKGDVTCDNWRGSLLDMVGKLFGHILQDTETPVDC